MSRALPAVLQRRLAEYRAVRAFKPREWVDAKCAMFNEYMTKYGLSGCAVSLSGGVDSAVTLGLMKYAASMPESPVKRVLGIAQPIHSSDWALRRAREAATALDAELVIVDQTRLNDELSALVETAVGIEGGPFARGQLRSYMRTPVGYFIAQLVSQAGNPCVVMGTGNKDEDGYLAYFCKAGDGVVDLQLIADIHKSEVFAVGAELGVPESILHAAPSADLWEGQTDEDELGFSYDFVELFTGAFLPLSEDEKRSFVAGLDDESREKFTLWAEAAQRVHNRNKHKLTAPINLNVL